MTTATVGEEGFRWFFGKVEDRDDPKKLGRVKVRIYNVHPFTSSGEPDKTSVPTAHLPWATPINSISSAGIIGGDKDGVGISPTGMMVGTTVFGFFADGRECQIPLVMGTLAALAGVNEENEIPKPAQEINSVGSLKNTKRIGASSPFPGEPETPYRSKYPFNKAIRTESGHLIEIDDSPASERIHIMHRTGTYVEVDRSGNLVIKSVNNKFDITTSDNNVFVGGNVNMKVVGDFNLDVSKNMTVNVIGDIVMNGKTVNINKGVNGAARINDTTIDNDTETNGSDTGKIVTGSGTVFIGD